ncbi:hypothetical protein IAR50_000491 [Cryptococcus sp. DSM 104548]
MVVKRDDSIVRELLNALHDDSDPEVRFMADEWAKIQCYGTEICLLDMYNHVPPDYFHTHIGLVTYWSNTVIYHFNNTIAAYRNLWSDAVTGTCWQQVVRARSGSTNWLCDGAFAQAKGDENEVRQGHVQNLYRGLLSQDQHEIVFPIRGRELTDPSNAAVHQSFKWLFSQAVCQAYINQRWGMVMLFNVCFVLRLTGANEISVSHIITRDPPANANTYTNCTTDTSLATLMASMAELGPLDPHNPMKSPKKHSLEGENTGSLYDMSNAHMPEGQDGGVGDAMGAESEMDVSDIDVNCLFDDDIRFVPPTSEDKKSWAVSPGNDFPSALPPDFRLKRVTTTDVPLDSSLEESVTSLTGTAGNSQSAEPKLSGSTAQSDEFGASKRVSQIRVSQIQSLRFGILIGKRALWDVYELPEAPGYVV